MEVRFTAPGRRGSAAATPPRRKVALVTWLAVYPLISAIFAVLGPPLLDGLSLPLPTFLVTASMVPAMLHAAMPATTRLFADRLYPTGGGRLEKASSGSPGAGSSWGGSYPTRD